jgi:hypothetical protein
MKRGKGHHKNMRENKVSFSQVLKRLGRTKVSVQLEEAFLGEFPPELTYCERVGFIFVLKNN